MLSVCVLLYGIGVAADSMSRELLFSPGGGSASTESTIGWFDGYSARSSPPPPGPTSASTPKFCFVKVASACTSAMEAQGTNNWPGYNNFIGDPGTSPSDMHVNEGACLVTRKAMWDAHIGAGCVEMLYTGAGLSNDGVILGW